MRLHGHRHGSEGEYLRGSRHAERSCIRRACWPGSRNGATPTPDRGAPLRLVIPVKSGIKTSERIGLIQVHRSTGLATIGRKRSTIGLQVSNTCPMLHFLPEPPVSLIPAGNPDFSSRNVAVQPSFLQLLRRAVECRRGQLYLPPHRFPGYV